MPSPELVLILDYALRAGGVPIHGVSVGTAGDRGTWSAQYTSGATAQQRTDGNTILATIDVSDAARLAAIIDEQANNDVNNDKKLQAVAMALWENTPSPLMTKAQLKARAVAIYKTL